MEREEAKLIVDTVCQSGNKTADFMLRPGEGREFLGKALATCTGYATSIMLKAISNALPTKQNLHRWYPSEHVSAACDLCGEGDETVARLMLACPKLKDSTTAAHDQIRRRISIQRQKKNGGRCPNSFRPLQAAPSLGICPIHANIIQISCPRHFRTFRNSVTALITELSPKI